MCVVELGKTRVGRTMNIWGITSFGACKSHGQQISHLNGMHADVNVNIKLELLTEHRRPRSAGSATCMKGCHEQSSLPGGCVPSSNMGYVRDPEIR
jgi:hypothetical protein